MLRTFKVFLRRRTTLTVKPMFADIGADGKITSYAS